MTSIAYIALYERHGAGGPAYRHIVIEAGSWLTAKAKALAGRRQGEECISVERRDDLLAGRSSA